MKNLTFGSWDGVPPVTAQGGKQPTGGTHPRVGRWPKLHLIYFLLAFFDIAAIGGGLYLSHQLTEVFEANTAKNTEWSERFAAIWKLGDLALAVNRPGNDVFLSHDVARERKNLETSAARLTAAIDVVRSEITNDVPAALASYPIKTLTFVDQAMATMVAHANRTLTEYEKGDIGKAAESMAQMDRSFVTLKQSLNTSIASVRNIQAAYQKGYEARVNSLKRFEYLLGGAIFLMVFFVVLYGHWVGRFISRKYKELEQAHDDSVKAGLAVQEFANEVQDVNTEVVRLNRELEANLKALGEAQEHAVRNAKMVQLGQLIATVAHELRNPLGAVRTSIFLLDRKTKNKGLNIDTQIDRINSGVTRCDDIISQLLDFARVRTLQPEDIKFDDWVAKTVQEQAEQLPAAVAVECHLGLGDMSVSFDPGRLSRVLINLISNASEAMVGRGDDPSKFATPEPVITITTWQDARGVAFSVTDNGPGIPPENLAKILEPLFTTKSFGTGLGLPAVEKIMIDHGGGLDVRSEPGLGAVFTAWFPSASHPIHRADAA